MHREAGNKAPVKAARFTAKDARDATEEKGFHCRGRRERRGSAEELLWNMVVLEELRTSSE